MGQKNSDSECAMKEYLDRWERCPNIDCVYSDFDKEMWQCALCDVYYNLYYEDMK